MRSETIKIFLSLSFIILFSLMSKAGLIEQADTAYYNGDYQRALNLYETIAQNEGVSPNLYYNMGNTYAKGGDYGLAMLYYLKALRMDPSNSSARQNMAYIESKVLETNQSELKNNKLSIEPEEITFFSSLKNYIVKEHLSDFWSVFALVFFILCILGVACYVFSKNVTLRKCGFFGSVILLLLSGITLIFAAMAANYRSDEGVITSPKVKLMSEASVSSKESPVFLTRGTVVKILEVYPADEETPKWYKVRLNSDFTGWIRSEDFQPVDED